MQTKYFRTLALAATLAASSLGASSARADGFSASSSYFRIDTDTDGTQLWAGASHPVGGVEIASDVYLVGTFAELDVGPSFTLGSLNVTPMAGAGFDFAGDGLAAIIPQLYLLLDYGHWYGESWNQLAWSSPLVDEAEDAVYTRNFLLYEVIGGIYLGPQVEATARVGGGAPGTSNALLSLPIGGRVNLSYGTRNTLGIFLGYETKAADDTSALTGRFTFVHEF